MAYGMILMDEYVIGGMTWDSIKICLIPVGILVLFILITLVAGGAFEKQPEIMPCRHCGKELKIGERRFLEGDKEDEAVLCEECYSKIPYRMRMKKEYARNHWDYQTYVDYLDWEEETREIRSQFDPDILYGGGKEQKGRGLAIDTKRGVVPHDNGRK